MKEGLAEIKQLIADIDALEFRVRDSFLYQHYTGMDTTKDRAAWRRSIRKARGRIMIILRLMTREE